MNFGFELPPEHMKGGFFVKKTIDFIIYKYPMREFAGAIGGGLTGAVLGLSVDTLLKLETPNFDGKTLAMYAIAFLTTLLGGTIGRIGGKYADINAAARERQKISHHQLLYRVVGMI